MRTIRSLLWIGSGRGLSESGMTEAPELDVTWVPNVEDAILLPKVHFDGILLEASNVEGIAPTLNDLERHMAGTSILVCLPSSQTKFAERLSETNASAAIFLDPKRSGPGIVNEINRALDEIQDGITATSSSTSKSEFGGQIIPITPPNPLLAPHSMNLDEFPAQQVIVKSSAMQEVSDLIDLAAPSPSTVLLTGETGVGKEVVARQLHARSCREEKPFVAINCAAFPESLLESGLFGHQKGAFTGADRAKEGLFLAAGAGTLFLDEIAEMGLPLQAKILRVLQEREIRPVGGTKTIQVHCRIVAATNRILCDEVSSGHFREDLFYRLNVFPIRIPPLRERRTDIMPLAHYFLALHGPREGKTNCHLSLASGQLLESYAWPGNVRELENEILRTLMLTPNGELITPKTLSPKIVEILEPIAHGARPEETLRQALDRVEAWMIRRALTNNGGRKAHTARKLGLTREGLYKKIRRLGIE